MSHDGPAFYDDAAVFAQYGRLRAHAESANETLERPVMRELLGNPSGHDFIDLGCGDAAFGKELLAAGARSYLGVDGSRNMVEKAEAVLNGTGGRVIRADLDEWEAAPDSVSRICSRLAFHYLEALAPLFSRAHAALRPGGLFVYSVEHPVITSHDEEPDEGQPHTSWMVDHYFATGRRTANWLGGKVVKYHRTVEDHFSALQRAGFQVESLRESRPVREHFQTDETFARRQRIPLFLFMAARKP